MGAPGQGKAGVSKLLLSSVEPKDPPGMMPLLFEGSKGNEAVSYAVAVLPGWFASVRMKKREMNTTQFSPQTAGNIFRKRFSYLSMGLNSDVPGDYRWSLGMGCVCVEVLGQKVLGEFLLSLLSCVTLGRFLKFS